MSIYTQHTHTHTQTHKHTCAHRNEGLRPRRKLVEQCYGSARRRNGNVSY